MKSQEVNVYSKADMLDVIPGARFNLFIFMWHFYVSMK